MTFRPLLVLPILALASSAVLAAAAIGQPAPGFTATDTAGKPVALSDFKGRTVVLEWVNPGCPYVRKHYGAANMQATQKAAVDRGVVWLAVNSTETASGDYLSPAKLAAWMQEKRAAPTATLMDEDGKVGRAYGARTTPERDGDAGSAVMYVAAPLVRDGQIVGAVSVGKPAQSFGQFVEAARRKTLVIGATSVLAVAVLVAILSVWLVRPFGFVADYVRYVRRERSLSLPRLGRRALGTAIRLAPVRYCPVSDAAAVSTGPAWTTRPPRSPDPGPSSSM